MCALGRIVGEHPVERRGIDVLAWRAGLEVAAILLGEAGIDAVEDRQQLRWMLVMIGSDVFIEDQETGWLQDAMHEAVHLVDLQEVMDRRLDEDDVDARWLERIQERIAAAEIDARAERRAVEALARGADGLRRGVVGDDALGVAAAQEMLVVDARATTEREQEAGGWREIGAADLVEPEAVGRPGERRGDGVAINERVTRVVDGIAVGVRELTGLVDGAIAIVPDAVGQGLMRAAGCVRRCGRYHR